MSRLLDTDKIKIRDSKTIISFETKGGGAWKEWDRYISIEGKQAYHIGNICGTCEFFFEKIDGSGLELEQFKTIENLNDGLEKIDKQSLKSVSEIIPNGKYKVILIDVFPQLIKPNEEGDYFSNEQKELWGLDGTTGLPHNPKINYYRGSDQLIEDDSKVFEFINPLVKTNTLDTKRTEYYKNKISEGFKPTAVALGVLDIKEPAIYQDDETPTITEHWCLSHYLLDGHHKIFAASELKMPATLLSFVAMDKGVSTEKQIKRLIKII